MKYSKTERSEAIAKLHEWLKPGNTVYTILRNCSRSGMSRSISLLATIDGAIVEITYYASRAMNDRIDERHGGIKIGGCGMDMGFSLAYNLGRALYPDGVPCTGISRADDPRGSRCLSNDHINHGPDRDKYDPAIVHRDGGYAFRHSWL